MPFDPRTITIGAYRPENWRIECTRCRRSAVVERHAMQRRFGGDITLAECARQVAAQRGCNLASLEGGHGCSVRVEETEVWTWARLHHARMGDWQVYLTCHRKMAGLKAADSCPEAIRLDILSLIALLGDDFPLAHVPAKLKCPRCGTARIDVEWHVPRPPETPAPVQDLPEPMRLRPRGAALARERFGVVKGG